MSNQLQQDHYKIKPKEHQALKISTQETHESKVSPEGGDLERAADQYLSGRGAQFNTQNKFLNLVKIFPYKIQIFFIVSFLKYS